MASRVKYFRNDFKPLYYFLFLAMKNGKAARKKAIQIHFPKVVTLGNWIPVEVR
jgi:hypothetical protein